MIQPGLLRLPELRSDSNHCVCMILRECDGLTLIVNLAGSEGDRHPGVSMREFVDWVKLGGPVLHVCRVLDIMNWKR